MAPVSGPHRAHHALLRLCARHGGAAAGERCERLCAAGRDGRAPHAAAQHANAAVGKGRGRGRCWSPRSARPALRARRLGVQRGRRCRIDQRDAAAVDQRRAAVVERRGAQHRRAGQRDRRDGGQIGRRERDQVRFSQRIDRHCDQVRGVGRRREVAHDGRRQVDARTLQPLTTPPAAAKAALSSGSPVSAVGCTGSAASDPDAPITAHATDEAIITSPASDATPTGWCRKRVVPTGVPRNGCPRPR